MNRVHLRPLASSLDPLPGESLTGFLLRTAYRLDRFPARIAQITGLLPPDDVHGIVPYGLLIHLPTAQRVAFSAAARLTEAEAAALCLSTFADRYPPVKPAAGRPAGRVASGVAWSGFDRVNRWCPECLAGDGTPVENSFGGTWRKTWRLAVVFGCARHRRLLEHLCPGCGRSMAEPSHGWMIGAVPYAWRTGVHPAHCRCPAPGSPGRLTAHTPACDAPLTVPRPLPSRVLTATALRLQRRILDLLDPVQSGGAVSAVLPATAAQYFTDLRLISGLVRASWPRISALADVPAELAELADRDRRRAAERPASRRPAYDEPPPDAATAAALLTVTDQLLSHDPHDLAEHIRHMVAYDPRGAGRVPWTRSFFHERPDCSPGFLTAVAPAIQGYAPRSWDHKRRPFKAPAYPACYRPAHVAQFLQDDWYRGYLASIDGISPARLRRAAGLYLCQLAAGGSLADAAGILGLPNPDRAYEYAKIVEHGARAMPGPREFEKAVHALAEHLGQAPDLIDYGRRRHAMKNWSIGPTGWAVICSQLSPRHCRRLQLGDRRRQTASTIVWARVTQGEPCFAPHPIRDQQPPDVQASWWGSDSMTWSRIKNNRMRPIDADLNRILCAYADDLAARIDTGEQPSTS